MTNAYPESRDEETAVISGPAPETENQLVPASLVATLTRAEIEQQLSAAHAFPRSPSHARDMMVSLATMDEQTAAECIYSVPRGGKQIRGPSIRFAEIVMSCWGNVRVAARVTIEDRIERFVEAEALCHDLQSNVGYVARARRRVELKRGKKTVDHDMVQIAGAAAISVARRNAILGCVPKPVWRKALEAVEGVIRGDQKTLVERRDAAVSYFNKMGIPTERILAALEVKHLDDISLEHLLDLNGMRSALKSGESSIDSLFPEEKPMGPKPETLEEKLQALSKVDPVTGEIMQVIQDAAAGGHGFLKDGKRIPPEEVFKSGARLSPVPDGTGAATLPPSQAAPVSPQTPPPLPDTAQSRPARARKPSVQERLQADGDAAAAKGTMALDAWMDLLTNDEAALVSPSMERQWRETAEKAAT